MPSEVRGLTTLWSAWYLVRVVSQPAMVSVRIGSQAAAMPIGTVGCRRDIHVRSRREAVNAWENIHVLHNRETKEIEAQRRMGRWATRSCWKSLSNRCTFHVACITSCRAHECWSLYKPVGKLFTSNKPTVLFTTNLLHVLSGTCNIRIYV